MKRTALAVAALAALPAAHAGPLHAPDTLRLSTGYNYAIEAGPGVWKQPPLPSYFNEKSQAYFLELSGETDKPWLRWSLTFGDLGEYSGGGNFVNDNSYDRDRREVTYPCDKCNGRNYRYYAEYRGGAKFGAFTLDPEIKAGDVTLFAQLGVAVWLGEFSVMRWEPGVKYNRLTEREWDWSKYYSAGVRYGNWFAAYYYIPDVRPPMAMSVADKGWRAGYSFDFKTQ